MPSVCLFYGIVARLWGAAGRLVKRIYPQMDTDWHRTSSGGLREALGKALAEEDFGGFPHLAGFVAGEDCDHFAIEVVGTALGVVGRREFDFVEVLALCYRSNVAIRDDGSRK